MRYQEICRTLGLIGAAGLICSGILFAQPDQDVYSHSYVPETVYTFSDGSNPTALLIDTQANLWVNLMTANQLVKLDLSTSPLETTNLSMLTESSMPFDLAVGPEQAVWFSQQNGNQVGRFVLENQALEEFSRDVTTGDPTQIQTGQDGKIWFTEFSNNRLGWVDLYGDMGVIDLPTDGSNPLGLVVDEQGNIWFTEWNNSSLGKIDTEGTLTEFKLPDTPIHPAEIILGPDQALWFTYESTSTIGRFDLTTQTIQTFSLETESTAISDLAFGADGRIWFIGYQSVGSFSASETGPDNLNEEIFDKPIFESSGRSQIIQGPANYLYYIRADSQEIYSIPEKSNDDLDIQLFVDTLPRQLLSGGYFETQLLAVNVSQDPATNLTLSIDLPDGISAVAVNPSSGSCVKNQNELRCTLDSLTGGSQWTVDLNLYSDRVAGASEDLEFTAQIAADQNDYLPANNYVRRGFDVQNITLYTADFNEDVDSHWSPAVRSTPAGMDGYLGPYTNDGVLLTFDDLPGHDEATICFDLYIMGSWDGSRTTDTDQWNLELDGETVIITTFSNNRLTPQAYPDSYPETTHPYQYMADEIGDFNGDGDDMDARYGVCKTFSHSANDMTFNFMAKGLDTNGMETWALDNVWLRINYYDGLFRSYFWMIRGQ